MIKLTLKIMEDLESPPVVRGVLISQTTVEDCSTRAERDRLSVIKDALQRIFLWSANSNHTWLLK